MELVIGDKAWSSWSLRPWLALKRTGAPFTETLIRLRQPDTAAKIAAAGGAAARIPVLKDGDVTVWDSLAICEYLAERFPEAQLWPADLKRRALARAAACEMHSGFPTLRNEWSMDIAARTPRTPSPAVSTEIARVIELWKSLRAAAEAREGPWLLGAWSIADAFYAPVCARFQTFDADLSAHGDDGAAAVYLQTVVTDPDFKEWEAAA